MTRSFAAVGTPRLILKRAGSPSGEEFPLGADALVGRFDPESGPVDVDLGQLPEATYISRHHTRFRRADDGSWTVEDLGSRNGTFLRPAAGGQFSRINGTQPLQDGDEVALGNARFEFRTGA